MGSKDLEKIFMSLLGNLPSDKIRVQHGSAFPIGFQIKKEDEIRFISLEDAVRMRVDLGWAIRRCLQNENIPEVKS